MVLILRTFLLLVKNFFRRKLRLVDETVLRFRVWPTDTDLNFHLNDGRYLSIAGLGRVDFMMRTGILRPVMKRGWRSVIGGLAIRYRREIRPFEKFELHTRMAGWDEKWFYFEQRFEKEGSLAALVYARGVMRTRDGAVPTSDVLALVQWTEPSPPLPEGIARWREAGIP